MKKKTLSGLLAICMVVAMLPTQAFASTGNIPVATQDVNVTSTVEEDTPETTPPPTDETPTPDPTPTPTPTPEPTPTVVDELPTAPPDDVVDAVASVLALIRALPTMVELEAQDPESEEFPDYLAALSADIAAARGAYDALTDEQKATVDGDVLAKLTELELMLAGVLAATTMATPAITITVNNNSSSTAYGGATLNAAVDAALVALGNGKTYADITELTITAGVVTTADWNYIKSLTALTDFTIAGDAAVTSVAAIPDVESHQRTFPTTIVTVRVAKVETIGKSAFNGCAALDTATFPDAITIGHYAFQDCISLELTTASFPLATTIGQYAFRRCKALTAVSFPLAATIGDNAFQDCVELVTASFPVAKSIGNSAFKGCTVLAALELGKAMPSVDDKNAFEDITASPRTLTFVGAAGATLKDDELALAWKTYDDYDSKDNKNNDGLWYGWKLHAGDAITVTIIDDTDTTYGLKGVSLRAALTGKDLAKITELTITAGVVTAEDWTWFKGGVVNNPKPVLSTLTKFTVESAVTAVADIPKGVESRGNYIPSFPITIVSVTIPQVKVIGDGAFYGCKLLATATFPGVTTIGASAFRYCEKLATASLPAATTIGLQAFEECVALTAAYFPAVTTIGTIAFQNCTLLATVTFTVAESIPLSAFLSCKALTTVDFPAVKTIGDKAFANGTALVTAGFPKAETIGSQAFQNCQTLATLKLGATPPTSVGELAFYDCDALSSLSLVGADGAALTESTTPKLSTAAAAYDEKGASDGLWQGLELTAENIKITVTNNTGADTAGTVGYANLQAAVRESKVELATITKLTITGGRVTEYDWNYIKSLTALKEFTIDAAVATVAAIPAGTANNPIFPKTIEAVTIPNATSIGAYAFKGCTALKLTNTSFPEVTTIGNQAFTNCTTLDAATFPKVKTIGNEAFSGCTELKLTNTSFPEVTAIGNQAFANCGALDTASFPEVTTIGNLAFTGCTALATADFPKATAIGTNAFEGCKLLATINFPLVVEIGAVAFAGCEALATAEFPEATTIGKSAFYKCIELANTTFTKVETIGESAFYGCKLLDTASFPLVKKIESFTFAGCEALATAEFPLATAIGTKAFNDCAALAKLQLGATPPTVVNAFTGTTNPRSLEVANATVDALVAYDAATAGGGTATDGLWQGWALPVMIKVNGTTDATGATLQAAVTASAITATNTTATDITTLTITGGKVTTADWEYIKSLTALTTFTVADEVTSVANIPNSAENTTIFPASIVTVTIPKVTSIGASAFANCTELATVSFPVATTIEQNAFKGCTKLATATFPVAATIGQSAFEGCALLATLKLGATVPTVVTSTFTGCPELRSLVIVDAAGTTLTGQALTAARNSYDEVATGGGTTTDDLWYGWRLPAITIKVGTATEASGATLQAAVEAALDGAAIATITELTITGGKVTTEDWKYIKSLTALATFKVDIAVASVAAIPDGTSANSVVTPVFPTTIVTVTIPNVTSIGLYAFSGCEALATVSFPAVATIGTEAFNGCTLLDTVSFPAATTIGTGAFNGCVKLTTASFPAATTIGASAFSGCTKLATLKLGATVPNVTNANAFTGITADPRSLVLVQADGTAALTGNTLNTARTSYAAVEDGTTTDDLWYGWELPEMVAVAKIEVTTPPNKTTYTVGDTFNPAGMVVTATYVGSSTAVVTDYTFTPDGALTIDDTTVTVSYTAGSDTATVDVNITVTAAPTPTGGGGGGGGSTTTAGNVIDKPVGSSGSVNPLAAAAKTAVAASKASTTSYVNYTNYTALTKDGLKAINDAAAAAVKGTKLQLNTKVQLDSSIGGIVTSRITVDPAKLTAAMPDKLGLRVWFDQKVDTKVTAVNNTFDKYFTNKLVTITFEEVAPLSVSMVLALKPDLSGLNVKNLHFYSYNPTTNLYSRIATPSYWVDRNGYSHITAPLGGSIIITDRPLTRK